MTCKHLADFACRTLVPSCTATLKHLSSGSYPVQFVIVISRRGLQAKPFCFMDFVVPGENAGVRASMRYVIQASKRNTQKSI